MEGKRDGFGIGELHGVPESTPEDQLGIISIEEEQARAWRDHLETCRLSGGCTENISTDGSYQPCGKVISERVYYSGTMGSCVMCEEHWIEYHHQLRHMTCEKTFEAVIAVLEAGTEAERNRVKHCARCGSTNASWNSGAGEDLCPDHWDEY